MRSLLRDWLAHVSWLRRLLTPLYVAVSRLFSPASGDYWEQRYARGGTSGTGSVGRLAAFKAQVLNSFVAENDVKSVVEFGCGDGDQLDLCDFPDYTGVDVSETILTTCRERFTEDSSKQFHHLSKAEAFAGPYDLALSLDVLYHLIEDEVFEEYMQRLFAAASRYVIIYSSNSADSGGKTAPHVRHRNFTNWIKENATEWQLARKIENPYPWDPADPDPTSTADFYLFSRCHG
ncbi:MAG: class I SAM-dependent methyltransferase [Proteobacteria bacterium]|nr:class I SAM-dependent methyltransferase [Pseudomonadota bacterium]